MPDTVWVASGGVTLPTKTVHTPPEQAVKWRYSAHRTPVPLLAGHTKPVLGSMGVIQRRYLALQMAR